MLHTLISLLRKRTLTGGLACLAVVFSSAPTTAEVPLLTALSWLDERPTLDSPICPRGPGQIPEQLSGLWEVSVCLKPSWGVSHTWIRYKNVETGEAHTLSCFRRGLPGIRTLDDQGWLVPPIRETGLHWDYDLRHEVEVQAGGLTIDRVLVWNPKIHHKSNPFQHGIIRDNCVTHVRDAWHAYTGEWYNLAPLHVPRMLARDMRKTKPDRRDASIAIRRLPRVY